MRFEFSTHALRCIDKAGGFDNYIINTKDKWLHSRTAIELKKLMLEVLKCKEQGMPMSQIRTKVFPQPKVSKHVQLFQRDTPQDSTLIGEDLANKLFIVDFNIILLLLVIHCKVLTSVLLYSCEGTV